MTDSPQHLIISSGLKGRRSQFDSTKLPPAEHVSFNQKQIGLVFGNVEIISAERRWKSGWKDPYVLTKCQVCGSFQWSYYYNLSQGKSKGCQQCSQPRKIPRWLDRRFTAAKQRCTNPNDSGYQNYGGRGILFCFESVLEAGLWMIENCGLPGRELEIDRINVDGNYEPGNLRWATHQMNCANQRRYMTSSTAVPGTDTR